MNRLKFLVGITVVILTLSSTPDFLLGSTSSNRLDSLGGDPLFIKFHEKLEFYINLKTRDFLEDLSAREKQLVQLLSSIQAETEARGLRVVTHNVAGFKTLYGISDSLVNEYNKELDIIIKIYGDLEKLEFNFRKSHDPGLQKELLVIKSNLVTAVDNSQFEEKVKFDDISPASVLSSAATIDSLLNLSRALDAQRKLALKNQDSVSVKNIDVRRAQVGNILSQWGVRVPTSEDSSDTEYQEHNRYLKGALAKQITLIDRLDRHFEGLLASEDYDTLGYPSLSRLVDEWKAERMTGFKTRLSEYKIIHYTLIDSASTQERDRMLSREIGDALLNYANKDYLLAEHQLDYLLDAYSHYYKGLDPLIFYRSESQYVRGFFDVAKEGYQNLIENYPGSLYLTESILRLMQITLKYNNWTEFYRYFDLMQSYSARANHQELEAAYYLAANQFFNDKRFSEAEEILLMINEKSPYYLPARLLLATVYNNLENYSRAIGILEKLSSMVNMPWTDIDVANYRNSALVRLGLIYYQRGEFEKALETFQKVSMGYQERDKALIGAAWAELKSGNYSQSSMKSSALVYDYLNSNYLYEAMVLAAHCRRIMEQPDLARQSLRYVANAHGVLELSKQYQKERGNLRTQKVELNRLENYVLEARAESLYTEIVRIRDSIDRTLLSIQQRSDRGAMIRQDYIDERNFAVKRLKELDDIVELSLSEGREDLAHEAAMQRARLLKVLETFQADQDIANSSYLVDYPLAAKEAEVLHKKEVLKSMTRDLESEKMRLEKALQEMQSLAQTNQGRVDFSREIDLEMLEYDIDNLRNRISYLRAWLRENEPEEMVTNFEKWTDYSGYGLIDISYDELENRSEQITQLWQKVAVIDSIFTRKQNDLAQMIESYDEEFHKLQKVLEGEKIRVEKDQRKYEFENLYFDNKEKETEGWDARYERLLKLKDQEK